VTIYNIFELKRISELNFCQEMLLENCRSLDVLFLPLHHNKKRNRLKRFRMHFQDDLDRPMDFFSLNIGSNKNSY